MLSPFNTDVFWHYNWQLRVVKAFLIVSWGFPQNQEWSVWPVGITGGVVTFYGCKYHENEFEEVKNKLPTKTFHTNGKPCILLML